MTDRSDQNTPQTPGEAAERTPASTPAAKSNGHAPSAKGNLCKAAAFVLAKRGWFIFPADSTGLKKSHKAAEFSNGRAWGMTRDAAEIEDDWNRWPDANIGIPTGSVNGIFVVETDIKPDKDIDGAAALKALEHEHGALPVTLMAISPSGSVHHYFKLPDGVEISNSVGKIGPGIDIRGSGGMVIAPPSLRNGAHYRWLNWGTALAGPPPWLVDAAVAAANVSHSASSATAETPVELLDTPNAIAHAIDWLVNEAPTATQGDGGDNVTFFVAQRLKHMGLTEATALELMLKYWNREKAIPAWAPDELAEKVANGFRYNRAAAGSHNPDIQFQGLLVPDRNSAADPRDDDATDDARDGEQDSSEPDSKKNDDDDDARSDQAVKDELLPEELVALIEQPPVTDLDQHFVRAVTWLGDLSWPASNIHLRLRGRPIVPPTCHSKKGGLLGAIRNILRKRVIKGMTIADFLSFLPTHEYLYVPTGDLWPATSVNTKLPPVALLNKDGKPRCGDDGEPLTVKPSVWLDKHRAVEQMTWAPGENIVIGGKLIAEGGWIERQSAQVFNLYRPPTIRSGNAAGAGRWRQLVERLYPDDAAHIVMWCAHRAQRPQEKINHCLLTGGAPGIGKDTILEPLKHAVAPWNFKEISPQQIMEPFNDYVRAVVLRISETRDMGDINRYTFYNATKTLIAAPPDTLRVNPKYKPQHYIPNIVGVIMTTNYRYDSIYLPADDRRHYVAWSELHKEDFEDGFWREFWAWYARGGLNDVVAYLREYDLSGFDAKAPPKQTPAFWQIVGASSSPEVAELSDILDELQRPAAVTLAMVRARLDTDGELLHFLRERKNRRVIPQKLEQCGYIAMRNPDAEDQLWMLKGKRQVVYVRLDATPEERWLAIRDMQISLFD